MDEVTIGLALAAVALFLKYRSDTFRSTIVDTHPMILPNQTHFSATRNKGEWAIARNRATPYPSKNHPQFVHNIHESLVKLFATASTSPAFLHKPIPAGPFVPISVSELGAYANEIGCGILHLLGGAEKGAPVGVFADDTEVDAKVVEFAAVLYGFAACLWGGDKAINQENLRKVLTRTEMQIIVVSESTLENVLNIAGQCKELKHIVVSNIKTISQTHTERAKALNVKLHTLESIRRLGREHPHEHVKPETPDVAAILFQEIGADVEGVVLTHLNLSVAISAVYVTLPQQQKIGDKDVCLIRPRGNTAFERALVYALLFAGAQVAFSASNTTFVYDVTSLKPSLLTSSAATISILSAAISSHSAAKAWGFARAKAGKVQELREGRCWTGTWWDSIFLKDIERSSIWNLRESQPTDLDAVETIRAIIGCQVFETFSRNEAGGLVCASAFGDYAKVQHIGYSVSDKPNPHGAVCIRGPAAAKSYYKDSIKSAAVVEGEGWIRLDGVYGELLPNGTLALL
ncbi:acetyl-CoA synthetase-like protein [Rhizoclosmatium globosum]|uniref:Acetyl-CoA synthetase-like protein n=1 Tax=Rhizoclosmatium globosum TaxID=329046 RepID=A0A1Y2BSE9_9FUNG|nr:acetyl-CoA synthetase-like protein [Rhizoclosmatium globosum]|eukprot:ORY37634.1 acetyl-CoA synthetase-like protein [Rhizoclosmatium globosum]